MKISQGEVYWWTDPQDTEAIAHPCVVVQDDVLNHSRLHTVVICRLTSNLKRVSLPGNLLLAAGEADLSRPSVVEVAKVWSIEQTQLGDYIGSLSPTRVRQILDGMRFVQTSFFAH